MIPASGFYAILDSRGAMSRDRFAASGLPPLAVVVEGLWLGIWSNGPLQAGVAADSGRFLVFHGALHNRSELLQLLDLAEDTPTPRLLLLAWQRWPDNWLRRLDGLYAIAHWRGDGRDLHLWRDPSGVLGLYHAWIAPGCLGFSSHLGTLVRLPGMIRRIERRALHEYLRLLDIAAPSTIYAGVGAVPAGEGLVLDSLQPDRQTVLPTPKFPVVEASFSDALEGLENCLDGSIARRLTHAARPAAFLSGGVDSSLLCALSSRHRPDLEAVTVGFDGPRYDETPIARKVATYLGLRHRILRFSRADYMGAIATAGQHAEQPMADPAEPATLLALKRLGSDCDSVLDGTGADELLGAMPPRHIRLAVDYAARVPTCARSVVAAALQCLPGGYAPIFDFEHPAETMMRWHGFRRGEIEALCGEPVSLTHTRFYDVFARHVRASHYSRYSALMEALPCDRLSQAMLITGMDVRFPFWAPEVEACLRGQPMAHRWQPKSAKRLLRALLARHIPPVVWNQPKRGFDFPLEALLRAEDFALVRRYLHFDLWQQWQVLSPDGVAGYGRRFLAGEGSLRFRIWALIVLAAWLEGHQDEAT